MKRILLLSVMIISIFMNVGCKTSNADLNLVINSSRWFLAQDNSFGYIMLEISGYTNGERVTVLTYGDGFLDEQELPLDGEKHFLEIVTIAFSHAGYTPPVQAETTVKAYRGSEYTEVKLNSGDIW